VKKFIIAATAALVATVSMAATAEAGWRHKHHGWKRHNWGVVVVSPRVVYRDYCFTKKVKYFDDWGNVYVKRVRVC
jgi:hypothetical protein